MAKRGKTVRRPVREHKSSTARKRAPAEVAAKKENSRLKHELAEVREQQAATSELLKVIGRSTLDLQPVFETLAENAVRLCEAERSFIFRFDGQCLRVVATHNASAEIRAFVERNPIAPGRGSATARAALERRTVHVLDAQTDPEYTYGSRQVDPFRTILTVPILKADELLGVILIYRHEVRPFTDSQIALLETFADQAVIAIENVRLFDEVQARTRDLSEALEQQTATSEVLEVISASTGELEPVFQKMLENATRVCGATFGSMTLYDGDSFRHVARHNMPAAFADATFRPHPKSGMATVVRTRQAVQIEDLRTQPPYLEGDPAVVALSDLAGARTLVIVPMLRENELIGVMSIFRQEVRPFTGKQVELVANFAKQAVIAIENTRLLRELRARTDDLSESLQQQTATAEVLKVISRSAFDLQAVFETLLSSAVALSGAVGGAICVRDGDVFPYRATVGASPEFARFLAENPAAPGRHSIAGRVILSGEVVAIPDFLEDSEYRMPAVLLNQMTRSYLGVPLLRNDKVEGALVLVRTEPGLFEPRQIELVKTFADQAVIAIENVRLFDEVQARTEDLRESLQQQTATAEVLKVISRSTFDLKAVLTTLVQSARELCDAPQGMVLMRDGDVYRTAMQLGYPPEFERYILDNPLPTNPHSGAGRAAFTGQVAHFPDVLADPEYRLIEGQRLGGYRTLLSIPLLREGEVVGIFSLGRTEPDPFTPRQIELVQTFADQAVIAIENVRLFNEVQERTNDLSESLLQQTATADVLKAISRSAFDLKTVLDALVEAAARLCKADQGNIARERDGVYQRVATYGFSDDYTEYLTTQPVIPQRGTAMGRALLEGKVVHIPDVRADPEYTFVEAQRRGGFRTVLGVPMLREGAPIGVLALARREVRPFTDKQIALVTIFADQAAIAIENVRLFESVEARTRELAASLEDLRTAQDRLVQTEKLASLGHLTAGIAHEIKNPLNFVNNFSAVSVELIDEMQETLEGVQLDEDKRTELNQLAETLRSNLDKVLQHGKRADAIVKNMLLHSREGSGEHRPVDVNALVEESLNLAYHGARAEKQGFNITLKRSFDPNAGEVDMFPQEITRALLNLISNGFYAATKRKGQADSDGYEPTLAAATRDLGDRVEIRIRDNGSGIAPEVKEKMFNPFFTTKPPGEGTGLGLSLSYDIIVKQHAGSIEVDTRPGGFTEFRVILPRAATTSKTGANR
jgi:GAF domain-containing protein